MNILHALTNERSILGLIIGNLIVLFALTFAEMRQYIAWLEWADDVFTILFALEAALHIKRLGWRQYWASHWNRLDFSITLLTTPALILQWVGVANLSLFQILRALRVLKFFRFLRFIPNLEHILVGLARALRASFFVLIAFFFYNALVAIFSCYLFKHLSQEHFGNALVSFYTIFKIFTLEGWHQIPEALQVANAPVWNSVVRVYFVMVVLSGGVFGLSLVNAIFVDEMVSDNNQALEAKISELEAKIDALLGKI